MVSLALRVPLRFQDAIVLTFTLAVDHVGNMKTFPGSVNLIVGPGFKKNLLPGYPINKDSHVLESDWEGRELVELEFNASLKIGKFKAIDYFKDGSFYLLDIPGHAVGHIGGLARVSKDSGGGEDSFVFMAGDTCHHSKPRTSQISSSLKANLLVKGGQWKPNKYVPLPKHVSLTRPIQGK